MTRRGALALAVVLAGLAGPALTSGRAGAATPAPSASAAEPRAALTVTDLRPRAPRPGDPFQVVGTVRSTGDGTLRKVQVRVLVGGRIDSRGKLALADRLTGSYAPRGATTTVADTLDAGAEAPLDLRMDVDDLDLGDDGVYPIKLQVQGLDAKGNRVVLDEQRTYLPWFGTSDVDRVRIAWVLPLVDQPHQAPDGHFLDDSLAIGLGTGGRLGSVLGAGRAAEQGTCATEPQVAAGAVQPPVPPERSSCLPTPITYAVDPELLDEAQTMAQGYQLVEGGAGSGTPAATAFLTALKGAVQASGNGLLALPFADPDLVALTSGSGELAADYTTAQSYGLDVTQRVLGARPLTGVSMPPPGPVTDQALDALASARSTAVVLDSTAVTADASTRATPGTRVALPATSSSTALTGLVVDAGLTSLLTPAPGQSARLAEQRWLVETAMIAAETPNAGRTLLVVPPRRGTVDAPLLTEALRDTGRVPWMCGVALRAVADATETCTAGVSPTVTTPRATRLAPLNPRVADGLAPLPAGTIQAAAALRRSTSQFTGAILVGSSDAAAAVRLRFQRALLRTVSSAWRENPTAGNQAAALLRQDLDQMVQKIVLRTNRVLLTSESSKLQVAVINELDQPVKIQVRLTAPTSAQLSTNGPVTVEIPARSSFPVSFDAHTVTSGRFAVRAELLDQNGVVFGSPRELRVRSTRYGTVALAVTGVAAGVLLVAAGYRITRRALGRAKPAPA
jgi:hypothetical protein